MELILKLSGRNPQAAFRELIEACRGHPSARHVAGLLVASAIEQVPRVGAVDSSEVSGGAVSGTVTVGDFTFVVSALGSGAEGAAYCDAFLKRGRRVVWLVPSGDEERARRKLRRRGLLRHVEVRLIDSYLAMRTLFTSLDRSISFEEAARRIVRRFNEHSAVGDFGWVEVRVQ